MKKAFLFSFVLAFAGMAFVQAETVKGDGSIVTKTIDVREFNKISLSQTLQEENKLKVGLSDFPFTFDYRQDSKASLTVTTDENVFPHLRFEVSNGELQIKATEGDKVIPTRLNVEGCSAALTEVNLAGGVDFSLSGNLQSENLEVNVAGGGAFMAPGTIETEDGEVNVAAGGELQFARFIGTSMEANVAAGGKVKLQGKVDRGEFNVAAGGTLEASDLVAEDVEADVAAGGKVYVHATHSLIASSVVGGKIYYKGNPEHLETESVLGGKVRPMEE